ncbi:hypothetical protein V8J88_03580 [Massilia sp. W12]|uniref:hypothetical protein n=1 Tax=Massilia sp. W12 TaxID=3126507 RepID=UPI0030D239E0
MSAKRKKIMLACGALIIFSANCLFLISAIGAYLRYSARHEYTDARFAVTGAGVLEHRAPFLYGEVNGSKEIYIDLEAPAMSAPEYLKHIPVGTHFPIKYNPQMSHTLLQGQSLRVLEHGWDFENDLAALRFYLLYIAGPSLLAGAAFLLFKWKKRRA